MKTVLKEHSSLSVPPCPVDQQHVAYWPSSQGQQIAFSIQCVKPLLENKMDRIHALV